LKRGSRIFENVADGGELVVAIPPIVPIIQVQLALVVPVVEVRDVAIPDRADFVQDIFLFTAARLLAVGLYNFSEALFPNILNQGSS